MYEYRHDPEVTYNIRVTLGNGLGSDVRMTVETHNIGPHLDEAAQAFFTTLAEHYNIEVTQSVRATGTRPNPVFPTG